MQRPRVPLQVPKQVPSEFPSKNLALQISYLLDRGVGLLFFSAMVPCCSFAPSLLLLLFICFLFSPSKKVALLFHRVIYFWPRKWTLTCPHGLCFDKQQRNGTSQSFLNINWRGDKIDYSPTSTSEYLETSNAIDSVEKACELWLSKTPSFLTALQVHVARHLNVPTEKYINLTPSSSFSVYCNGGSGVSLWGWVLMENEPSSGRGNSCWQL